MSSADLATDDSPSAPLLVPYARLPVWRRAVVLAGLAAPLATWGREAWKAPRDVAVLGTFLMAPVVAAMGLSVINHPGAQLFCRGVAWFQLMVGVVAAVGAHAWEPSLIATGAGLALLAMGSVGLDENEDTRGSFAPVAFRRSLMASIVMATAEIQGLSGVSSMIMHESSSDRRYAVAMVACAAALAVGVVGLYRLRVWGLLMHLVAMVGLASLAVAVLPDNMHEMNPLFVWFDTVTVQMLLPLPMLLAIVSRRRVGPTTASPWPARLFRMLIVAMMATALLSGSLHRWV